MSRETSSLADMMRFAAAIGCVLAISGCTVFGGTATARYDGRTLETSTTSASIGPEGAERRSSRTVMPVRPAP